MDNLEMLRNNGVDVERSLQLLGDEETYKTVMGDFVEQYQPMIDNLKKYKEESDMANYAIEVHSLKTSAKYVGFMTLAELALDEEMAAKENNIEKVNSTYNELMTEANKCYNLAHIYLGNDLVGDDNKTMLEENNDINFVKKTVVIADDSSLIRDFTNEQLSDKYNIKEAKSGREVATIISKDPDQVAALLLDLNMPDINGYQVLNWFRDNNLFEKIPVSVISGTDDSMTIHTLFEAYPIVDMLNKPYTAEAVKEIVEKTVNSKEVKKNTK